MTGSVHMTLYDCVVTCINVEVVLVADTFEKSFHLKIISHITSSLLHRDNVRIYSEAM